MSAASLAVIYIREAVATDRYWLKNSDYEKKASIKTATVY